jgi:hypothetical protein
MEVSSIGSVNIDQITSLGSVASSASTTAGVDADGDHDGSGTGSTRVSAFAQILSQLQSLQQTDPTKLKTVLSDIAKQLQVTAQQDGGSQGQSLSNLAAKFQQAAQTGDLSSLKPTHHHHHHGAGAYQQASGQNPLSPVGGSNPSASPVTEQHSQVLDIINEVIAQDLGTTSAAAS